MKKLRKDIILNKMNVFRFIFIIASLVVIITFVTASSYTKLAIASLFYPPLVYFAFRLFPRYTRTQPTQPRIQPQPSVQPTVTIQSMHKHQRKAIDIADIDKRAVLKMIGATGLSFFIYSLFTKKAENFLLGRVSQPESFSIQDTHGKTIHPAETQPTDGYRISQIDEGDTTFFGFTDTTGAWFIMKTEDNEGSFRYARGKTNFPNNWSIRESLIYDYYHKVFP